MNDDAMEFILEGGGNGMNAPPPMDAVDQAYGTEARVMLKGVALPERGTIAEDRRCEVVDTVRAHAAKYKIPYSSIAHQIGVSESALSETLRRKYKADDSDAIRKLNAWVDDDERRRRRAQPIGLYETSVLIAVRDAAAIAKRNARTSDERSVHGGGERIVMAVGPSGIGKSAAADAVAAMDPNSILIRIQEYAGSGAAIIDSIIESAGWRSLGSKRAKVRLAFDRLKHSGRLLIIDEFHRATQSGYNVVRDLAEVCGIPILLLGTSRMQRKVDAPRSGAGPVLDEQFSRRVAYVVDLLRGSDGQGGTRRPFFSTEEIMAIFKSDKVKLTYDAAEFLAAIACCIGIGMLGQAANIYEKAHFAAKRANGIIDEKLLRLACEKVLMPVGVKNPEIIRQIDSQLAANRRIVTARKAVG